MIDVLKAFYTIHYNFAALSVLLLLLLIFLLTKKNFKWSIIVLAVLVVFNVFLYKRTDGKQWSIAIPPPESHDPYFKPQPKIMTFSVRKDWVIVDEKGEKHHWCWVDDYWDKFSNTDVVAWIWGENASKKMMQSTETRAKEAGN